jgi:hypothetical protein
MEKKFSIEEIKKYLQSQDSFGDALYFLTEDALYFLTEDNIEKANQLPCLECLLPIDPIEAKMFNGYCEGCYVDLLLNDDVYFIQNS